MRVVAVLARSSAYLLFVLWMLPVLAGSGYAVSGVGDLDAVFAPQHAGWPTPSCGSTYVVSGSGTLASRYAALSTGTKSGTTTHYAAPSGADLNTCFAALGTTAVTISTQPGAVSGSAAAGNPSGTVTSSSTSVAATHGNSAAYACSWHIASGSATATAPSSCSSAVHATVNAGSTITGTWYATVTDGVTSANSNVVPWSLINTTPATMTATFSVVMALASQSGNPSGGEDYYVATSITLTSGALPAGFSIVSIDSAVSLPSGQGATLLTVGGFGSNIPNTEWMQSITVGGAVVLSAPSGSLNQLNGEFEWEWASAMTGPGTYSLTLVVSPGSY